MRVSHTYIDGRNGFIFLFELFSHGTHDPAATIINLSERWIKLSNRVCITASKVTTTSEASDVSQPRGIQHVTLR